MIRTETSVGLFILIALGILLYMTFNIGVFRLHRHEYIPYVVYFHDISGLQKKADVKIAGVKVGWIESTELIENGELKARANIMVSRKFKLHTDAYAMVRQEGLLGNKYLEVIPGDSILPALGSGSTLNDTHHPPVNIDDLLRKFQVIAANVEDITGSLKSVVSEEKGDLKELVINFNQAAQHLASFSDVLDRTVVNNEQNLNNIMSDVKDLTREMRESWPTIQNDINRVSTAVEGAASEARDGMRGFSELTNNLNSGRGLLGKLLTEDETYGDIKTSISSLKNYFVKAEQIGIVFDAHSEGMWGIGEHFVDHVDQHITKKDTKSYFGFRIHPSDDHFYIAQLVGSRKGTIDRSIINMRYSQFAGTIPDMCPTELLFVDTQLTPTPVLFQEPVCQERTVQRRGTLKLSLQVAKCFSDVALRFGLFESTAGFAIDYDIPFKTDRFRWVTTLEAYDFYGDDRINDERPHLKWLNSLYFFKNLYVTFGADDFVSRHNANAFFGFGMRFADDDMKYLIGKLSGAGIGGGTVNG